MAASLLFIILAVADVLPIEIEIIMERNYFLFVVVVAAAAMIIPAVIILLAIAPLFVVVVDIIIVVISWPAAAWSSRRWLIPRHCCRAVISMTRRILV